MRDYRSEQRRYQVYCGELRVTISYKGDESFHHILINLDNPDPLINPCGCAYSEALANSLTMLIRRIEISTDINAVIKNLAKQRCKYGIKSCPDAVSQAIKEAFAQISTP
jgi:hypothetical protein